MPAPGSSRRRHVVFLGPNSDAIKRAIEDGVKYWPRTAWPWSSKTGTSLSRCASTASTGPISALSVATIFRHPSSTMHNYTTLFLRVLATNCPAHVPATLQLQDAWSTTGKVALVERHGPPQRVVIPTRSAG